MGLESTIEKLNKYVRRLETGKAQKIKPEHVQKVIGKLEARQVLLLDEIANAQKPDKKERLTRKLELVQEQMKRAAWLQEEINDL